MSETSYSVSKYGEYVPKVVRDASDKYITKFFEQNTGDHPKLTKEMVNISFISFQCYLYLGKQPAINSHIEDVHGIEDGIETLTELQVIEVDPKGAFTLPLFST